VSTYQPNELNQYTQRTVAGAIDVFGLADPQAAVQVNGATASRYGSYFHKVVSVDNAASAQYPEITIQAGNNSAARHAFVPKNPEVFEYDADGNLTQDGRWTYEWNGENRLTRMTTRSDVPGPHYQLIFQYDWMGRRIRKTVVNTDTGQTISDLIFLYDGWNLIAEVDAQTGELIRTYVWGPDLSGAMQGAGGIGGLLWINLETGSHAGRYFAAYDGNGNVMGLVSADDGSLVAQYEYGPFAEPLRATGPLTADNPFRFSTKYTDSETGLLYYGYRYYSPTLGRWLSRDPVEEGMDMNFLQNDSIDYVDFVGLWKIYDALHRKGNFRAEISPSALIRKHHLRRYIYRYRILKALHKTLESYGLIIEWHQTHAYGQRCVRIQGLIYWAIGVPLKGVKSALSRSPFIDKLAQYIKIDTQAIGGFSYLDCECFRFKDAEIGGHFGIFFSAGAGYFAGNRPEGIIDYRSNKGGKVRPWNVRGIRGPFIALYGAIEGGPSLSREGFDLALSIYMSGSIGYRGDIIDLRWGGDLTGLLIIKIVPDFLKIKSSQIRFEGI